MTVKEFKKVGRLLKELYKELEAEALKDGIDIFGEQYQQIQARVRLALLTRMGFTLEEYIEAKDRTVNEQKEQRRAELDNINESIAEVEKKAEDKLRNEDVVKLIEENAKAPQIIEKTINKIERETTVEKPTIVENTIIEREEYDDAPLWIEIGYIIDRLDKIKEPKELDREELFGEVRNIFAEMFDHNINTLNMPDFRKLGMGLQAQIDTKVTGIGTTTIFVSETEPTTSKPGDIWVDPSALSVDALTANYTLQNTDYAVSCSGTFTVSLPATSDAPKEYVIKNTGTGIITVSPNGSDTIDNETSIELVQYDCLVIRSTGSGWIII